MTASEDPAGAAFTTAERMPPPTKPSTAFAGWVGRPLAAREWFSAAAMSGMVSRSVPSRSNTTALSIGPSSPAASAAKLCS